MPVVSKETLKGYFDDGDVPVESNYVDLIDTLSHSTAILAEDTAVSATSLDVDSSLSGDAISLGWIVIDIGTIECEIRKITSVVDNTVNWSAGLTYAHDADDPILFVANPVAEATWFGYKPDNSTNNTTALTRAFLQVDYVILPEGDGIISSVAITTNQRLSGSAPNSTILRITGSGTGLTISGQYVTVENLTIAAVTGNERNFDGMSIAGSRHLINNVNIFNAYDGVKMPDGVYHCKLFGFYMYNIGRYGFHLGGTTLASNNTIDFKQLIGYSTPSGSIGIYVEGGTVNQFIGGQIDHFATAIRADSQENKFLGMWLENNTLSYHGTAGRNYTDSHLGGDGITLTGTASLITPENGFGNWLDYSPVRPSVYDLKLFYLFNEGTGTTIVDHSGNSRDGTLSGSNNSWVEGLFDTALQIGSGGRVDIPIATLSPTSEWTIALLWKPVSLDSYNNELFIIKDGTDFIQLMTHDDSSYYRWRFYDGSTNDNNINSMLQTGRWTWAVHTYNPTSGVMTNLDPVRDDQTFTESNTVSTISDIEVHAGGTHTANYQLLVLWQRTLSKAEIVQFVNGAHWLGWMHKFN